MEEITEQRSEKVNRLKIAEKERDNLSGSKLEAEAFIEKEKDIRRKKNTLYQLWQQVASSNCTDFQQRLEKVQEKLAYEKGKMAESEGRLRTLEKEYEQVKAHHSRVNSQLEKSTAVRCVHDIYVVCTNISLGCNIFPFTCRNDAFLPLVLNPILFPLL